MVVKARDVYDTMLGNISGILGIPFAFANSPSTQTRSYNTPLTNVGGGVDIGNYKLKAHSRVTNHEPRTWQALSAAVTLVTFRKSEVGH
jgi:hypothetical protein